MAVDYNHYPSTQYANSGPYGTSIGATYEYSGGVNDHRPESPSDDKVLLLFVQKILFFYFCCCCFWKNAHNV